MRAVALRVRSFLTGRWWSTAVIVIVVAIPVAAVLALAAGARRTASAADRYTQSVGGDDDVQLVQQSGSPLTADVRALPLVRDLQAVTFVYTSIDGQPGAVFAGDGLGPTVRLLSGREPSAPNEFVATRSFLDAHRAAVGGHLTVTAYDQQQVTAEQVSDPPRGASIDGVLVGIIGGPSELDDPTPVALFPVTLLQQPVGVVGTIMFVHLRPGATLDDLRGALGSVPAPGGFIFQSGRAVSDSVRNALQAQAVGLVVLAIVSAIAVVAALGQLLVRQLNRRAAERRPLLAIGYTDAQTVGEQVGWAAIVAVAGCVVGAGIALVASQLFPRGFARHLDPHFGRVLADPLVLVAGAAALSALLVAWVGVGALAARHRAAVDRPSPTAETLAHVGVPPSTVTGVRFALGRRRDNPSAWVTLATLLIATATVLGAVVFAASLRRLVNDPARFGANFNVLASTGDPPVPFPSLDGEPGVRGASLIATAFGTADGHDVDLVGVDPVRGALLPVVLSGRFPASADEVAIGAVTARQLGVGIGDQISVTVEPNRPAHLRIVGTAVIPAPNSFGSGGGHGVAMLMSGLTAVDPDAVATNLAVNLAPGAPVPASLQSFQVGPVVGMTKPPDVVNLTRSESVPIALAVVVAVLATLTLVHSLITSVRRRRGDVAVLRSLGADRRWVEWAVHTQASTVALVALAGGVPLGVVLGRVVFRMFIGRVGLVSDPTTPVLLVVLTALAVLVIANLAAAVPARQASRAPVAALLHVE